jgi:hypothetical protein
VFKIETQPRRISAAARRSPRCKICNHIHAAMGTFLALYKSGGYSAARAVSKTLRQYGAL